MEKGELLELAKKNYEKSEVADLETAIDFATEKHLGQFRKSEEAYITHPLKVAGYLIEWGMDIDSVVAGVSFHHIHVSIRALAWRATAARR